MKVDLTTWCTPESLAGKYLASTLEEIGDKKLVEKVNVYFHRFQIRMKALNDLDKSMRIFYLGLLLEKTEKEIELNVKHEKVKSLMMNLITAFYRMEMSKI
jgi:hypothetical protein